MEERYGINPANSSAVRSNERERARAEEVEKAVEELFQTFFTQYTSEGFAQRAALNSPILSILELVGNVTTEESEYHEAIHSVAQSQGRTVNFILAVIGKYHNLHEDQKKIILKALGNNRK